MDVSLFDYSLPEELIAAEPSPRGTSRMMVLYRDSGEIKHSRFNDLPLFIDSNTTVVLNKSRVIPARFFGRKKSGGMVEFLYLTTLSDGTCGTIARSSKPLRRGDVVLLEEGETATIVSRSGEYCRILTSFPGAEFPAFLERCGDMPLPPYILKRRGEKRSRPTDRGAYQTIYAEKPGSIAAPTAGLHFTEEMIERLRTHTNNHVEFVLLHVGVGTFMPVKVDHVEKHTMPQEQYEITQETSEHLNRDKALGRRILAIGTTTVRALETAAPKGTIVAGAGLSSLFIYPGYSFRFVDALLTNFHLPRSTLLMLVSAFAGREKILEAYREAIREHYRFFSYGDCMLIL